MWRRWGPMGLVFLALGLVLTVGIGNLMRVTFSLESKPGVWQVLSIVVGFGIGALANWLFAVKLVEPKLDKPDAYPPVPSSTLFFLPLRHWTWVIVAVGLVFAVANVIAAVQQG